MKGAEQWFKWMKEAHVQPNVTSYSSIMNACAQSGDVKRAEQWFKWMEEVGMQPDVKSYNSVTNACVQKGIVNRAGQWFYSALVWMWFFLIA